MSRFGVKSLFAATQARASQSALDPTVQLLRGTAVDAQRSRLPQMAAALSYRTIFGLLPILAVGLWLLHRMVKPDELREYIKKGIDAVGLSSIAIDQKAAADWFVGPMPTAASSPSIEQWVTELVGRINDVKFDGIGLVGGCMLIYAAVSMIVEIERAFNQVFRVPRGRSWVRRVVNYWTLITLGSIGLVATFSIQTRLGVWIQHWTGGDSGIGSGAMTISAIGYATQWLISGAVLLLLYTAVPNTRVRFVPALYGALFAAAVFETSKFGFGEYVKFSAGRSYARLYGSLALFPLFLLWVYFSWLIVLFGVQLTYRIQHGAARTQAQPIAEFGPVIVEPTAAMVVATALTRAFNFGLTLDAPTVAARTSLADPVVRLVLAKLTERALLHRIEGPSAPGVSEVEPTYTLARPARSIKVGELLSVGFELAGGPSSDPVLLRIREAQVRAAGDETLEEAVAESDQGTPAPKISPALLRAEPSANGRHERSGALEG